jgi:hypothetical protein
MAFLCVSQQGEFKNTTKPFWNKTMLKAFCKNVEGKNTFFGVISPPDFFIAFFGRFSA